jgi:flagellar biosynthesis/type III secretory pathway chaperone
MSKVSEAVLAEVLDELRTVLDEELEAAEALLAALSDARSRIERSSSVPDIANGLPHQNALMQLQALAESRRELESLLVDVSLPLELRSRTERLEQLAGELLRENQALGNALQVKMLFFNRLFRHLGEQTHGAGVYARDGVVQTTVSSRKLDTI